MKNAENEYIKNKELNKYKEEIRSIYKGCLIEMENIKEAEKWAETYVEEWEAFMKEREDEELYNAPLPIVNDEDEENPYYEDPYQENHRYF